jgi:hypothetical protein
MPTREQDIPLVLSAGFAFAPPVKAAAEVEVALAVCVKNGPLNVPLLHGMVTVAVAVALTMIDDLPDEWLVVSAVYGMVCVYEWLDFATPETVA